MRIAIVGAGCAGLSLAWHLLDHGADPRGLVLLDPRTDYGRDRTWCFFDVVDHPFAHLVDHRWARWRVRAGGPWVERSAPPITYAHLRSDAFYGAARQRLAAAGVELRLGVRVGSIEPRRRGVRVRTTQGAVEAELAFDSRPPRVAPPGAVSLVQHFGGRFVRCREPRFDPGVATLMDFSPTTAEGIHFFYVLPYDEHRALVEATWFGTGPGDRALHARALDRWLSGMEHEVLHTERGAIPMTTARFEPRTGERVYHIGLAGGLAKPSTGYAFLAIQRYSAALAERLARDPLPEPPEPRSALLLAQDRLFLAFLARHPDQAPEAIVRLFERVPPGLLARYLSDAAAPRETLAVMAAMPPRTMVAELLRSPRTWLAG